MGDVIVMGQDVWQLTPRERDVLELMATGLSNMAICDCLYVSPKTLERHVQHIYSKLGLPPSDGVHRRVSAVLAWHAVEQPVASAA